MRTLIELFEKSVKKFGSNPYMWEKHNGRYRPYTYKEIQKEVKLFGAGLMALGLNKGDRISLLSEGCKNWIVAELGMFYAGVINVPLSLKLESSSEVAFRLKHSGSRMIIVSKSQLEKVKEIADSCKELETIVHIDKAKADKPGELGFGEIVTKGESFLKIEANRKRFDENWQSVQADDLANISYTSGTTADPKGIMLTHLNYAENVRQADTLMSITPEYKTLTILPWDHAFAHTACLYCFMYLGASIAAQELGKTPIETLKNIPKNIREIKPDLLMSVPAISKAFRKNIEGGVRGKGKVTEKLFKTGLNVAYKYYGMGFDRGKGWRAFYKPLYKLFDAVIFKKVRENFGGNLKFFIGGGALLDVELQKFFAAIGIPVMQGYGLSEAAPVISSNALHAYKFGSSGRLVKYLDIKICDEDGKILPDGEKGEIVVRGDNVMKGYWKNEEATKETIRDGWLYTGDMGYVDKDGFLYVLGRFKSLLISGDGEKYSPEGIEEALVDQSPFIDQCMLYNNQSPYTGAFIVPNIEALKRELKSKGMNIDSKEGKHYSLQIIQNEIDAHKKDGDYAGNFPERWLPAVFLILPESFNENNHLLNSTMKMVRGKIVEHFSEQLDFMYSKQAKDIFNKANFDALDKLINS